MSPETPIIPRRPSTPLPIGTGQDEPNGVIDQRGYGPQPDKVVSVDVEGCVSVPDVVIAEKVIVGDAPLTPTDLDEVDEFLLGMIEDAKRESAEGEVEEDEDGAAQPD